MELWEEITINPSAGARKLVAEYAQRLYETARYLCPDESSAEDLVFRTLEQAVAKIDQFGGRSSLFTWLYRILVNFVRMDARRKAANALDFTADELPVTDEVATPAELLAAAEDAAVVRAAVMELSLPLRTVTVFRYFEDMSVSEIAEVLGIAEGTVKSRLNAARAQIHQKLCRTIR